MKAYRHFSDPEWDGEPGTGTVRDVWLSPLPVREDAATTMFLLWETSVRVSERALRNVRAAPLCMQKKS